MLTTWLNLFNNLLLIDLFDILFYKAVSVCCDRSMKVYTRSGGITPLILYTKSEHACYVAATDARTPVRPLVR
jgi:hypothetical protein